MTKAIDTACLSPLHLVFGIGESVYNSMVFSGVLVLGSHLCSNASAYSRHHVPDAMHGAKNSNVLSGDVALPYCPNTQTHMMFAGSAESCDSCL